MATPDGNRESGTGATTPQAGTDAAVYGRLLAMAVS